MDIFNSDIGTSMADEEQAQVQTLKEALDSRGGCEYEVTLPGEKYLERSYDACSKHPQHETFIPINRFNKAQLPEGYNSDEVVDIIYCLASLTTRIMVNRISQDRPQTWPSSSVPYPCFGARGLENLCRTGTGFIDSFQKMFTAVHGECPCPECAASKYPRRDWWEIRVSTATHLVYDNSEACRTFVDCFPHPGDTNVFHRLHSVRVCETPRMTQSDWCILVCVTHDMAFGSLLEQMSSELQRLQATWSRRTEYFFQCHTVIVSHLHGMPTKAVTIGRTHHITVPLSSTHPAEQPLPFLPGLRYRLPSTSLPSTNKDDLNKGHLHTHGTAASSLNTEEKPVPPNATFTLPKDAYFARKYVCECDKANCFTFPVGTKFFLPDGKEWPLSEDCEFVGWPLDEMLVRLTYSTATCPGSSGASIFTLEPRCLRNGNGRARAIDRFIHCRAISPEVGESGQGFFINIQPNAFEMRNQDLRSKA